MPSKLLLRYDSHSLRDSILSKFVFRITQDPQAKAIKDYYGASYGQIPPVDITK